MSPKVKGTKSSALWRFFEVIDAECAKCSMCKQKFSYRTSTSNLKKHLKNKHPTVDITPHERFHVQSNVSVTILLGMLFESKYFFICRLRNPSHLPPRLQLRQLKFSD